MEVRVETFDDIDVARVRHVGCCHEVGPCFERLFEWAATIGARPSRVLTLSYGDLDAVGSEATWSGFRRYGSGVTMWCTCRVGSCRTSSRASASAGAAEALAATRHRTGRRPQAPDRRGWHPAPGRGCGPDHAARVRQHDRGVPPHGQSRSPPTRRAWVPDPRRAGRECRWLPFGAPARLTGPRAPISHRPVRPRPSVRHGPTGHRVANKIPESGPLFVVVVQHRDVPEPAGGEMQTALRPIKTVDVLEDLRRQAQQAQELAHAGGGHPVPAGKFCGVLNLAGVEQPSPLAGAGKGINDPGPPGPRGTGAWPAGMARSRRGWHAARFPRFCRRFWVARSASGPWSTRTGAVVGAHDRRPAWPLGAPRAPGTWLHRTPGLFLAARKGNICHPAEQNTSAFCGDQIGSTRTRTRHGTWCCPGGRSARRGP